MVSRQERCHTGCAGGLLTDAFWLDNYPGIEGMTGEAFSVRITRHLTQFGLSVTRGEVSALSIRERHFVVTSDLGEIRSRCIIVAAGTEPLRLAALAAGWSVWGEVPRDPARGADLEALVADLAAVGGRGEAAHV